MGQYDKRILNALIDSYENSLLSRGENKVAVRVSFAFNKRNLPEYFNESSLAYEDIHACIKELERRGFLAVVWRNGKTGHIVQKVLLNESRVSEIYRYLNRVPKSENEKNTLALLKHLKEKYPALVAGRLASYLEGRIRAGKSVREFTDLSKPEQTESLMKAIFCIETNEKSCYVREFSIRCFGDSKVFEEMFGKLGRVWRCFGENDADNDIYEILAEHSIYHTPNYVYFKGAGVLKLHRQRVDLESLHQGLGLSGEDLEDVQFLGKEGTKRVVTIENLTTFFRWQEKGSLIIYLGGYHNLLRRKLLKMVYEQCPDAEYLHFGDIDVGGFEIYEDLCAKTGIPFRTYHMGVAELEKYCAYTKVLTENDKKRLDRLLEKKKDCFCEYREVLEYMKGHGRKLEQECVIFEMETTGDMALWECI